MPDRVGSLDRSAFEDASASTHTSVQQCQLKRKLRVKVAAATVQHAAR